MNSITWSINTTAIDTECLLVSGDEAVALGARDAGVRVAAAYPGTPATKILVYVARYPELYSEWSINEKVSLEVAIGASLAGNRALWTMKHVGMNVTPDALMTQSLLGNDRRRHRYVIITKRTGLTLLGPLCSPAHT